MKKGLIILTMIATFMLAPIVKADTLTIPVTQKTIDSKNLTSDYNYLIDFYNNNYSERFNYYIIIRYSAGSGNELGLYMFNTLDKNCSGNNEMNICIQNYIQYEMTIGNHNLEYNANKEVENETTVQQFLTWSSEEDFSDFDLVLASNYNFKLSDYTLPYNYNEFELTGFYSDNIILTDSIPTVYELAKYNSWTDYENNHLENYTEINLDNYEYVLLSLKNYNQTNAFQTNLQVKGQIGITPIYNYGQTSKDAVTGSQVQDRCNISYSEYTSYPLYIIQSDLQNNAIYAVKECSEGSSFKFDNTVFDVTYVTEENKNNPTVTINGNTYDVIPYNDLPSTATKNEEDNYIPGQSGSATDTGGLDSAIKNVQQKMSEIWNTFTYFTDFINQIFSVFPDEVKTILLSAFTIMIVIGLIKIFIGK